MNRKLLKDMYFGGFISREEYLSEIKIISKIKNKVMGRKLPKDDWR